MAFPVQQQPWSLNQIVVRICSYVVLYVCLSMTLYDFDWRILWISWVYLLSGLTKCWHFLMCWGEGNWTESCTNLRQACFHSENWPSFHSSASVWSACELCVSICILETVAAAHRNEQTVGAGHRRKSLSPKLWQITGGDAKNVAQTNQAHNFDCSLIC